MHIYWHILNLPFVDTFLTLTQYRLRKTILLFWSWITFRGKEKKIKPTVGLNYRKNKVSELKLVFAILINILSNAAENLKIHRVCPSLAWDQCPRIYLVAGCAQLPHHVCGVRWSQNLSIPISPACNTPGPGHRPAVFQVYQLLLHSNLDTCNHLFWVRVVSPCPSHPLNICTNRNRRCKCLDIQVDGCTSVSVILLLRLQHIYKLYH